MSRDWPPLWQPDARAALEPYIDTDWQVNLWVDPPSAVSGTRYAGFVFTGDEGTLRIVYDRSGRPGVLPWELPRGPLLRMKVRSGPRKHWRVVYTHPHWSPQGGLP